jgi:Protein of unknown function (DUF2911)
MNAHRFAGIVIAALTIFCVAPVMAQQKRVSPHETIGTVVDGNRVTIVYGRPYTKDPKSGEPRKIWGTLVPFGKVWRTGADEATLFITQQDLQMGDATIPAGAYTLWTLPNEDGTAKLIINKQIGQWGQDYKDMTKVYDEKNDLARVDLKKEAMEKPNDQFTMSLGKNPSGGGLLKLMWDDTQYSVTFTVKK